MERNDDYNIQAHIAGSMVPVAVMADEATMSYNAAWGGTIPFPENTWKEWYDRWLIHHENKRFYRYLQDTETKEFVGEIAYHYDEEREIFLADMIVASEYRGRGYGSEGLQLLCDAAKANGAMYFGMISLLIILQPSYS